MEDRRLFFYPCYLCDPWFVFPRDELDIKIQRELVGVRTQPDSVHFLVALVPDPPADHVAREHVALQQEIVVLLQVRERWT